MPRFVIHHVTKYNYPEAVRDSANQVMLFPIRDERQEVQSFKLKITGDPNVETFRDYYGNEYGSFMYVLPHTELKIETTIAVVTKPVVIPVDSGDATAEWANLEEIKFMVPYIDFLKQEQFDALEEVKQVANAGKYKKLSVFDAVNELNGYVYQHFKYIKGITSVETTVNEIWKIKAGVCQDFAHMLLVMLRLLNIPSRYVSGYVCPHDHKLRGEGATHAWVEAYIPFYGWLGLDPTNNCVVSDLHVRLAVGRNFSDVSPVRGTYKGTAQQTLEVGVSVSHEDGLELSQVATVLKPHPVTINKENGEMENNSYRRYLQMMQQQQ
jgi:transglutaminase-like putative cysteine protease